MPTRLNFYTNYIHSEFAYKEFDWEQLKVEGRYDRLFDMFNYMRPHKDGICHYYPQANVSKKSHVRKNVMIKEVSVSSSGSAKSGRSSGKNGGSGKSSRKKEVSGRGTSGSKGNSQEKGFFRKETKKVGIYTAFMPEKTKLKEKEKVNVSIKGKSKRKDGQKSKRKSSK